MKTNYGGIKFHVINKDVQTILCLRDILRLDLIKSASEIHSINNAPKIVSEYSDLFESALGKLHMVYHMKLDESVTPVICSASKIPVAMTDDVINELINMEKLGVIEPIQEPTSWVSNMVPARKNDGSIRSCIHPVNLNKALLRPHHPVKRLRTSS